jgi:hypothetical protein
MSIANILEQPRNVLYANGLDIRNHTLEIGTVTAPRIDIGGPLTPVFINGTPFNPIPPTPVIPGKLAYFTSNTSTSIDDCDISVTGVGNTDLTFNPLGSTFVNFVDSVDLVNDILNIGRNTENIEIGTGLSTSILIGHEGIPVQIAEGTITNYVRTSDIDRNGTNDPVNIGATYASVVNIGRSGHNVNIADGATLMANSIDTSHPAGLFLNTNFITMGQVGGTVQLNSNLSFAASGPAGIDYYTADRQFGVQGSGPFAIQAIGNYSVQRLSSIVTLNIIWSGAAVAVTAPSALSITPVLMAAFRPATAQTFSCIVRTDGISYTLGFVTIGTSGSITIAPVAGMWVLLQTVDFGSICCSYDILI